MKTIKIFFSFVLVFFIFSCDNTPDNVIIVEPFPVDNVNNMQSFSYKNQKGESLFEKGIYKEEYLSLICTDEQGNDLYINGQLVADIENIVAIADKYKDNQGNITSLNLGFGRDFNLDEVNNLAIGYYKLKYDKDKYDTIVVHFYYSHTNGFHHYITKVVYNGVEYDLADKPIIEIIKEE
ncbi:MAG TPA: hypothetical protein VLY87_05480 [Flavobacterium sp.]|nr:hypothetical protein [Flavobacterium sp.]